MNLCMVGCTHHEAGIDLRQQLAFGDRQVVDALGQWRDRFPDAELALLSTCNRVELYAAAPRDLPDPRTFARAILHYHGSEDASLADRLLTLQEGDAAAHLYRVASSLDSMVIGEPQILAQVKHAYRLSRESGSTGPFLHELFQSAVRTAKRVHRETNLHKHRVSIPSVAISDFASRVFERFDDKHVLVIGAGEMAAETLRYLRDAGAQRIFVANRDPLRGQRLADAQAGQYVPWETLWDQLADADLVVSTTAAEQPIVDARAFDERVAPARQQRALFVLDLAVPRDFDPAISDRLGVYLYSLDDLQTACDRNRQARARELPAAERIVVDEASRFLATARHRAAAPVITGLRRSMEEDKQAELKRLFHK
ncbi:MAG: glutamyl-tRNA reductase, partial [Planctomycetales bacterium]|nr:glutamyl-tRNA reductase [Planctomycetales bacterium]